MERVSIHYTAKKEGKQDKAAQKSRRVQRGRGGYGKIVKPAYQMSVGGPRYADINITRGESDL
jgi:ribosomal protein L44E